MIKFGPWIALYKSFIYLLQYKARGNRRAMFRRSDCREIGSADMTFIRPSDGPHCIAPRLSVRPSRTSDFLEIEKPYRETSNLMKT